MRLVVSQGEKANNKILGTLSQRMIPQTLDDPFPPQVEAALLAWVGESEVVLEKGLTPFYLPGLQCPKAKMDPALREEVTELG